MESQSRLALFPVVSGINEQGHLVIGGCDTVKLAEDFGTPLYVFDESGLRGKCREFKEKFKHYYNNVTVVYAAKAFINRALALLLKEEGLGLDVVSAGELNIARSVDFPMESVYFPGNNKSEEELKLALELSIGRIVVDNFHELSMLERLSRERGSAPDILLRITPGIDPHTHKYITTGIIDSKFGFLLASAEKAVEQAVSSPYLNPVGLHMHIGSLLFETEPYQRSIDVLLEFAAAMKKKYGFELRELNVGGGYAIQYTVDKPAPDISVYAQMIASQVKSQCQKLRLDLPKLVIEPGRSIIGRAGVALYRAGAIKDIPGVRRYVSVDGGMADNIRPALYEARYEALVANKAMQPDSEIITIAGKFCESGDILIRDIELPPVAPGDILAIPACGAYCIAMGNNYNASLKPGIVMVKDGQARLIRRRETYDDLTRCDVV
jgi:diaminopimelate decarboxylase